ncbi:hypothetical protein QE152_g4867 [Popillia japonica]|uniref:Uncharacterized protein n=1 Tax=Popillia japonica TaxID=7064 RepID=A0AAW1N075_POPJA
MMTSSSVLEFVIQHLDSTGGSLRDLEPCLIPQIPIWVFKTYVRPIWIEAMWNFLSKEQQDKLGHYRLCVKHYNLSNCHVDGPALLPIYKCSQCKYM